MTSDPDVKVTTFFEVEYLKKWSVKVTIAQEEIIPNAWNGTMFDELD